MDSVLHAYKDISILTILTIFGSGLSFIAQVIFARNLSIIDYGVLSSSIVAVTLLIPLNARKLLEIRISEVVPLVV